MPSFQRTAYLTGLMARNVSASARITVRRAPFVRYNSSINNKVALNDSSSSSRTAVDKDNVDTAATTPTAAVVNGSTNNQTEDKNEKPATVEKLSFVPVINIPKTEFAYHSFFSLNRPLLGLADDSDRPFFSNRTIEEEAQDRLDDALADCMKDLQPFVPPAELNTANENDDAQIRTNNSKHPPTDTFVQDIEDAVNDEDLLFYSEFNRNSELPIHHMPDSSEVVDFLSDIESKMKLEDEELSEIERKLETIQKAKSARERYQHLKKNKKP